MAKKVVSSVSVHKMKLMKRGKKKKLLLKRVVDYLKSDTYMFAPLLSSQSSDFFSPSTVSASSSGVDAREPILDKNENLLGKVKEYMISDQYLYAPLAAHQPLFHAAICTSSPQDKGQNFGSEKTDTSQWKESMEKLAKDTRDLRQKRRSIRIENLSLNRYPFGRSTIITHTQMQKETVKHVVQQNCRF